MLNVNELTSRLADMSDQQLLKYAQLHKADPYTLALASSESKRRAQLRAAGQRAAKQPTIADQRIAQMGAPAPMPQQIAAPQPQLPEQQGIGMLPAQNVEGMADGGIAGYDDQFVDSYADAYAGGGIVAFDNGGRVPSFNLSGGNQTAYGTNTTDVFSPPYVEDTSSPFGRSMVFLKDRIKAGVEDVKDLAAYPQGSKEAYAAQQKRLEQERALLNKLGQLEGLGFKQQTKKQQEEAAQVRKELDALRGTRAPETKSTTPYVDKSGTKYDDYGNPMQAGKTSPVTFESKLTPRRQTGTGTKTAPGTGTTTTGPSTEQMSGFTPGAAGDLTAEYRRMRGFLPDGSEYDTLARQAEAGFAKRATDREASKPKGKAYEGLEALLGKEEEKAKGKEARNLNMALINAGLAIAGGKSQYALQNIAQGAQVGTKQYQEGLDKLEAAALERRKQAAIIEEARRAEARGDWKEAEALNQQAFETGLGIKRSKIEGLAKISGDTLKAAGERVNTLDTLRSQDQRAIYQQKMESEREKYRADNYLQGQRIMASAYGARGGERGALTPALLLKEYNDNLQKDMYGDFKKQFPTFQHYMAVIQQQQQTPSTAPSGIKFLGFEK